MISIKYRFENSTSRLVEKNQNCHRKPVFSFKIERVICELNITTQTQRKRLKHKETESLKKETDRQAVRRDRNK